MMTPADYARLRAQLIWHEGRRLKPYQDTAGNITIGVGRNLTDRGISDGICELMLDEDISRVLLELAVTFPWWEGLDPIRQRVLADMDFNLGLPRLRGFKRMLAAVAAYDYTEASKQMLASAWAQQVGRRAVRLAAMMATGREQPLTARKRRSRT